MEAIIEHQPHPVMNEPELLKQYEAFLADYRAFLDLPPAKATVSACDRLLDRASDLDGNLEAFLVQHGTRNKQLETRTKALMDRLATTSDTQMKDRVETLHRALDQENETIAGQVKAWAARRQQLQEARDRLYQYRAILEILENK